MISRPTRSCGASTNRSSTRCCRRRALITESGRLPGAYGRAKMGKSQANALALSATEDAIRAAVRRMYIDPDHLRVTDPGRSEGNVVFTYLDAFEPDRDTVHELKAHFRVHVSGRLIAQCCLNARSLGLVLRAAGSPEGSR